MPIRVYDIAKKLGVENRRVIEKAKELGIRAARSASSSLDKITGEYLEEQLQAEIAKTELTTSDRNNPAAIVETLKEKSRFWHPIEDLPTDTDFLVNPQVMGLVKAWQDQAAELKQKESYQTFLSQLRRQWAIETGILERLYTLSEGATKTLIEKGLDAAFISHEDTNKPVTEVLNIIRDQHKAIEGLNDFISGHRPLGKSYIKELHSVLTAHQETYEAVDTLGRDVNPALPHGEWKVLPNSLGSVDSVELCPPVHVESEMERLLQFHAEHQLINVPPNVEAAWLHHRFSLIHPFTDGNGRVARCLATLVFLKANWFPLVITRDDREPYIKALRCADGGNLKPLVELFDSIQSKAIRQAFSLSEETIQETVAMRGVLKAAKDTFKKLREEQETLKKQVLKIADLLHAAATHRVQEIAKEVTDTIKVEGDGFRARASSAANGEKNSDYHSYQIIQCAKSLNYFANRAVYQAWVLLTIQTKTRTEILFAFHGIGKSTGLLVCSVMVYDRQMADGGPDSVIGTIRPLSEDPFSFAYTDDPSDVSKRFRRWLEQRLVEGIAYWQKNITV